MRLKWRHSPKRCHGNDGVPERLRDAGEHCPGYILLSVEHDGGKYDNGHREREEQKSELAGARLESVSENPQTLRVARELKDAEDAEHSERDERSAEVLVVGDAEPDVVRQDRYDVNDAHHRPNVSVTVRRSEQPQQIFAREDHDARRVETEQFHVVEFAARRVLSGLQDNAARYSFSDVDDNRDGDEEAGDVVEHQCCVAAFRVFERTPHFLP